ncbi:hypothetical protein THAOC_29112, partial [Thalassiosira oceanica]
MFAWGGSRVRVTKEVSGLVAFPVGAGGGDDVKGGGVGGGPKAERLQPLLVPGHPRRPHLLVRAQLHLLLAAAVAAVCVPPPPDAQDLPPVQDVVRRAQRRVAVVLVRGHDDAGPERLPPRGVVEEPVREGRVDLVEVAAPDESPEDPPEGRDEVLLAYLPGRRGDRAVLGRRGDDDPAEVRGERPAGVPPEAAVGRRRLRTGAVPLAVQPGVDVLVDRDECA